MHQRAGCHADGHVDIPPVSFLHEMTRSGTRSQDRRVHIPPIPCLGIDVSPSLFLRPIEHTPPIVESGTMLVTTEGSSAS